MAFALGMEKFFAVSFTEKTREMFTEAGFELFADTLKDIGIEIIANLATRGDALASPGITGTLYLVNSLPVQSGLSIQASIGDWTSSSLPALSRQSPSSEIPKITVDNNAVEAMVKSGSTGPLFTIIINGQHFVDERFVISAFDLQNLPQVVDNVFGCVLQPAEGRGVSTTFALLMANINETSTLMGVSLIQNPGIALRASPTIASLYKTLSAQFQYSDGSMTPVQHLMTDGVPPYNGPQTYLCPPGTLESPANLSYSVLMITAVTNVGVTTTVSVPLLPNAVSCSAPFAVYSTVMANNPHAPTNTECASINACAVPFSRTSATGFKTSANCNVAGVFLIEPCSPPSSASSTAEIGDTYYAAPHRRHCGSNTGTVIGLSVALGVVCVVLIAVVVAYEVAAKRKD